ncbi:hypothetical protein IWW38_001308 [Coemansia aciculifera]|uniref:Uncharacterized protein n=1 Tax=Coemansia aciculifera TaxID=417176 RepID=A0ACC1M8C7_9FUNG|nr:hypothetical protein IWW38_001308 [Coemansia aciculifera]
MADRHNAIQMLRMHIQLRNGLDIAMITLGAVLMFANTILLIYALLHHTYPPLRAKNLKLIAVLYFSMLIWYLGTIGTNYNLPGMFKFNDSCILFGSWFRILLGIFLYIHVHIVRLYIYIRLFNQSKRVTIKVYVIGFSLYALFVLAYGLPTTILQNQLTVRYIPQLDICDYGEAFKNISFSLVWAGWITILITTYLARNINSSFNEFREMLAICIISSISLTYLTVVHNVVDDYIVHRWARNTTTLFEYLTGQSPLFILLRVPVYNCLFRRTEYQREFFRKMHSDGMAAAYGCLSHQHSSFTRQTTASNTLPTFPTLPLTLAITDTQSPAAVTDAGADNKV